MPISGLFEEIQNREGIAVVRRPLDVDIDGAIFHADAEQDGEASVMIINTHERGLGKQHATAAHELGHHMEDGHRDFAELIEERGVGEGFAEGFATELLMPEAGVREWMGKSVDSAAEPKHIAQLAAYFRASYEMAAIRLETLGLITKKRKEELRSHAGRRAAYEGGVEEWYDRNIAAINVFELPPSYLSAARSAYAQQLISIDRLAELEFQPVEEVRKRLKEQGLLLGEDEEGSG